MKKYNIIYADPPWKYNDKRIGYGGAEKHYKTIKTKEICDLSIQKISAENSILFLWVMFPMLKEGLEVVDAWGFNYKTVAFTWVKANKRFYNDQNYFFENGIDDFFGVGTWTRSNAEICLLATKGKIKRESANVRQVIYSPIGKHSEKPDKTRDRIIKLMGDLPRIELFCRKKIPGWDAWGNEIESNINFKETT